MLVVIVFYIVCLLQGTVFSFKAIHSRCNPLLCRSISSITALNDAKMKALIIQNSGGGHGSLAYYLAKEMAKSMPNAELTILQDKCNNKKEPFKSYPELSSTKIVETKLNEISNINDHLSEMNYDVVIDNWSKGATNATFTTAISKACNAKQHIFISSAGMYKAGNVCPHVETDPVKVNGPREVELEVEKTGIPYTFLRPQYIYGDKASKKYLDFFIGRAYRKLPIPIPMHGEQLVCLTHYEDVASLLCSTMGNSKAMNQIYNCGTDRFITYKGLCSLIHKEFKTPDADILYMYYEPKDFVHWDGSGVMEFPFRRDTFITTPDKIKVQLQWTPKRNIQEDIQQEVADYMNSGSIKEEWGMDQLRYDLEVIASKDLNFMFTYPFLDNSSLNPEKRPYPFEASSSFAEPINQK